MILARASPFKLELKVTRGPREVTKWTTLGRFHPGPVRHGQNRPGTVREGPFCDIVT